MPGSVPPCCINHRTLFCLAALSHPCGTCQVWILENQALFSHWLPHWPLLTGFSSLWCSTVKRTTCYLLQYLCELARDIHIPGTKLNSSKSERRQWEVSSWSQNISLAPHVLIVPRWSFLASVLWSIAFACMTDSFRQTPVVVVTTKMAVTIWLVRGPPWRLNVSSVSCLSISRLLPSLHPENSHFFCPYGFMVGNTGPFLSGFFLSSLFHSCQVETQMTVPNVQMWWHAFKLLLSWQRDPFKPFLPPCV